MVTVHSRESGSSGASGGGSMFGPRTISMPRSLLRRRGGQDLAVVHRGVRGGLGKLGVLPELARVRDDAPQSGGDRRGRARQVHLSVIVPERPGKLRLKVLTLTESEGGAWPIPTHGPHTGSSIRAPARTRSE